MTTIFVRNNGSEPFSDGLDGVVYHFEPGKEIEIPEIAAKHVFGYGDDNKEPYLVRQWQIRLLVTLRKPGVYYMTLMRTSGQMQS